MNFGPLNRDGGERRLNVAITRAREELVVYATLRPEHIDLTRTNAVGVKHLKTFLDYASRGPVAIAEALTVQTSDAFDSPFEEQVCDRLRTLGFLVDTQVGTAGYRIDLGVRHPDQPGRYVLAVECDGAHYHSARSARERDRLRAQILEGLGWRIHRVWSTDWWQTPDREIQKIVAAIEKAKLEAASPPVSPPREAIPIGAPAPAEPAPTPVRGPRQVDSRPTSRPTAGPPSEPMQIARGASPGDTVEVYRITPVPEGRFSPDDVHDDRHRAELKRVLLGIVEIEAPLSLTVLARRVAPYFAIQRTSSRLEERLRAVLGRAVTIKNEIIWRVDQDPDAYAGVRLAPTEARREAQEVPLEEVANAAARVLRANIALSQDELVKLTAKSLGFPRSSGRVADHLSAAVALLVKRGRAKRDGDKVVLA
jgi:very-short-patch-repair endonuclease